MELYASRVPYHSEGRKQPYGYLCGRQNGAPLWVVGHYETDCGGGDTISQGMDEVYRMIHEAADRRYDVMYEGLILQSDVLRCIALQKEKGYPLLVIGLTTPIEECLRNVQARRDAKDDAKGRPRRPLNPENTISKFKTLPHQERRIRAAGVKWLSLDREEAFRACKEAFGLSQ
jgi:Zeta toxin.